MPKVSNLAIDFVRKIFARENKRDDIVSTRELALGNRSYNGFINGSVDSIGYGALDEYLGLDRRMLYRYSDYEQMDEYPDISCLTGDSPILIEDINSVVKYVQISSLVDKDKFYVFSYDKSSECIVKTLCAGAKLTGKSGHNKLMVNVHMDNGKSIRCTYDHLFMDEKEEWIEAGKLNNTKLMSYGGVSVVGVDLLDDSEDVYDLQVDKYHNFICNGVVVHNSALDIYADDATQTDSARGHVMWIESKDDNIVKSLEDLFYKRLKIDEHSWEMVRTLCKYGSDYEELVIDDNGVKALNFMPPATVRRIESNRGELWGFVQSYSSEFNIDKNKFKKLILDKGGAVIDGDTAIFEPWRVAHMRLRSKHRESLYGWPVIEAARWIWKRLVLLEDAVLYYRLSRSPSRLAYYIDVGGLPRREAEAALKKVKNDLKKKKFINPKTGKIDMRFNPLAFDEDIFLATRDGQEKTRVEMLNGPSYQQIEDVNYFQNKLYSAIKIPKAFLGHEENLPSRATLSAEDIRFARTELRVQRTHINGLEHISRVDLACQNIDPASVDYSLKMPVPSDIFEMGQLETRRMRAELASMMQAHVSMYWLLSHVYGLSDTEIEEIKKQKKEDNTAMAAQGGAVGGGVGGRFENIQYSDKDLLDGNKITEKKLEEILEREIEKKDSKLIKRINETSMLLHEILRNVSTKK